MKAIKLNVIGSMLTQKEIVSVTGGLTCWCVKTPCDEDNFGDVLLRTGEASSVSISNILSARKLNGNAAWNEAVVDASACAAKCCGGCWYSAAWWIIGETKQSGDCPACGCGIL